jgi:hypothetical protein
VARQWPLTRDNDQLCDLGWGAVHQNLVMYCNVSRVGVFGQHREDDGRPLDLWLGPGFRLMEQRISAGGTELTMIVPQDVDAVMDWYIQQGMDPCP